MISETKYNEIMRRYFGADYAYCPECASTFYDKDINEMIPKCANCIFRNVECADNPYRRIENAMEDIRNAKAQIAAAEKWDSEHPDIR